MKKKLGILFIALSIVLILVIIFLFNNLKFTSSNPDPYNVALSQSDIANLPDEFILNSAYSQSFYTTSSIKPGFITGYDRSFQYQNSDNINNSITIMNSVSFYNSSELALNDFNAKELSVLNFGCDQFNISNTGDKSFGCILSNYPLGGITSYAVYFYKGNKVGFIYLEEQGSKIDLTNEAISYSQIVANRF